MNWKPVVMSVLAMSVLAVGCEKEEKNTKPVPEEKIGTAETSKVKESEKETKETNKTEDKEVASKENAKPEDAKTDPNSNPNNVEKKQSENKNQPVEKPANPATAFNREQASKSIQDSMHQYAKAISDKNLNAYLNSLSPKSPSYADNKALMSNWINEYDLRAKMENVQVLEVTPTNAKVRAVQTLRDMNESEFKDERSTILFEMSNENGWKISNMTIEKTDYLPKQR
ncbi:hypothetical protein [Bacillus cereus]|nr:hypothetical protein BC2903_54540 [Bacillus cereus]